MHPIKRSVRSMLWSCVALSFVGCVHHHAKSVNCDGPLRPINRTPRVDPAAPAEPTSMSPAAPGIQEP
jgi:hypothetical protein